MKQMTGAVRLVVRREPRPPRDVAHRVLVQRPEREQRPFESRPVQRVQEIALILGGVGALEQPHRAAAALDPRVVAGRHALGAEPARVVDERGELHLAVAHHVRIRGHPALDAADEPHEDVVPVRVGAVHRMQRHAEPVAYALRVGEILGRRAVSVLVVLLPVLHEHRLHRDARLDQAHQRDRGVDAAGDRDHRRRVFLRGRERSVGEGGGGQHRGVGSGRAGAHCNRPASREAGAPTRNGPASRRRSGRARRQFGGLSPGAVVRTSSICGSSHVPAIVYWYANALSKRLRSRIFCASQMGTRGRLDETLGVMVTIWS